jgi:hypothetical protein
MEGGASDERSQVSPFLTNFWEAELALNKIGQKHNSEENLVINLIGK